MAKEMSIEQATAIQEAIQRNIPLAKVEIDFLQKLQPVPFIREDARRSEKEFYAIRSVDDWMIVVEYNPTDNACKVSLIGTTARK